MHNGCLGHESILSLMSKFRTHTEPKSKIIVFHILFVYVF
jgi:hypothetical protein